MGEVGKLLIWRACCTGLNSSGGVFQDLWLLLSLLGCPAFTVLPSGPVTHSALIGRYVVCYLDSGLD